jgi:energy-coupling factor transporter ATP-binding protein EcfA2
MRGRVGALIELGAGFNPILTARENIYVNGAVLGFSKKEIDRKFDAIVDFAEIEEFLDTPVQNYSSGMKVRLGFAVASELDPNILLIDEVLAVGDFHFRQKCYAKINDLRAAQTIVLVSHAMDTIRLFCDRAIVVDRGGLTFNGNPFPAIDAYLSATSNRRKIKGGTDTYWIRPVEGEIYWNKGRIESAEYGWTNKTYKHGQKMSLQFSIRFRSTVRNLIIGVPVWDEYGLRVTAFNSDYSGFQFKSDSKAVSGRLDTTCCLNPGIYSSVITIHDGPEILFRQLMEPIEVLSKARLFGISTFPQTWSCHENKS